MTNKIFEISDNEFVDLIKNSTCIKEVLFKLNYTTVGNSWGYALVKERMHILGLKSTDFKGRLATSRNLIIDVPNDKIFKANCKHSRSVLRRRIIKENLLDYKCAICGISEWNNKKISLEIDHINGINNDNRIENLRFLCPNCHSQTSTYGSKNSNININDYEISDELEKSVLKEYNRLHKMKLVAQYLGIKYSVVRQIMNKNGLLRPNQKFVIRYDKNHDEIQRFGTIREACEFLISNNEVKTRLYKTCRKTFLRNCNSFWLNSYWEILDA